MEQFEFYLKSVTNTKILNKEEAETYFLNEFMNPQFGSLILDYLNFSFDSTLLSQFTFFCLEHWIQQGFKTLSADMQIHISSIILNRIFFLSPISANYLYSFKLIVKSNPNNIQVLYDVIPQLLDQISTKYSTPMGHLLLKLLLFYLRQTDPSPNFSFQIYNSLSPIFCIIFTNQISFLSQEQQSILSLFIAIWSLLCIKIFPIQCLSLNDLILPISYCFSFIQNVLENTNQILTKNSFKLINTIIHSLLSVIILSHRVFSFPLEIKIEYSHMIINLLDHFSTDFSNDPYFICSIMRPILYLSYNSEIEITPRLILLLFKQMKISDEVLLDFFDNPSYFFENIYSEDSEAFYNPQTLAVSIITDIFQTLHQTLVPFLFQLPNNEASFRLFGFLAEKIKIHGYISQFRQWIQMNFDISSCDPVLASSQLFLLSKSLFLFSHEEQVNFLNMIPSFLSCKIPMISIFGSILLKALIKQNNKFNEIPQEIVILLLDCLGHSLTKHTELALVSLLKTYPLTLNNKVDDLINYMNYQIPKHMLNYYSEESILAIEAFSRYLIILTSLIKSEPFDSKNPNLWSFSLRFIDLLFSLHDDDIYEPLKVLTISLIQHDNSTDLSTSLHLIQFVLDESSKGELNFLPIITAFMAVHPKKVDDLQILPSLIESCFKYLDSIDECEINICDFFSSVIAVSHTVDFHPILSYANSLMEAENNICFLFNGLKIVSSGIIFLPDEFSEVYFHRGILKSFSIFCHSIFDSTIEIQKRDWKILLLSLEKFLKLYSSSSYEINSCISLLNNFKEQLTDNYLLSIFDKI